MEKDKKDKTVAILLVLFTGGFGLQWFYLDRPLFGVLSILFFWTGVPSIIALFHFVRFLTLTNEQLTNYYAK